MDLSGRFWAKVDKTEGCWIWTAAKTMGGYGRFVIGRKVHYAHRVAYELARGSIADGLTIDHLCRNKACVNPGHLEPVTGSENARRYWGTHCKRGHERTPENTRVEKDGTGRPYRRCAACHRQLRAARPERVA
jgi:hypothetical protein